MDWAADSALEAEFERVDLEKNEYMEDDGLETVDIVSTSHRPRIEHQDSQ